MATKEEKLRKRVKVRAAKNQFGDKGYGVFDGREQLQWFWNKENADEYREDYISGVLEILLSEVD